VSLVLVAVAAAPARAEDPPAAAAEDKPKAAPPHERSTDIDVVEPGFGQDRDEEPRVPRIRLEASYLGAIFDSSYRFGKTGQSNRFDPQSDLGLPRWTNGFRTAIVLKLHRYIAIGAEYFRFASEGPTITSRSDYRTGFIPSEVPYGSRLSATMELQQLDLTARFVAADDDEIRAEFAVGFVWVSYRLGFHPKPPYPALGPDGRLPGGGLSIGTSNANEAYLAPSIGTYFCWNFHPRVAIFFDTTSAYVSLHSTFGSLASINRAGFRVRVVAGLEIVVGLFVVSGQVYDIKDRIPFVVGQSHTYHQASWLSGGPDVGLSFTY
jgi:hypothetical protein